MGRLGLGEDIVSFGSLWLQQGVPVGAENVCVEVEEKFCEEKIGICNHTWENRESI